MKIELHNLKKKANTRQKANHSFCQHKITQTKQVNKDKYEFPSIIKRFLLMDMICSVYYVLYVS